MKIGMKIGWKSLLWASLMTLANGQWQFGGWMSCRCYIFQAVCKWNLVFCPSWQQHFISLYRNFYLNFSLLHMFIIWSSVVWNECHWTTLFTREHHHFLQSAYSSPQKVTECLCLETMDEWISILFGGCQYNIECSRSPNCHNILIERYHYNPFYTWGGFFRYFFQSPIFLQSIELFNSTAEHFESCL